MKITHWFRCIRLTSPREQCVESLNFKFRWPNDDKRYAIEPAQEKEANINPDKPLTDGKTINLCCPLSNVETQVRVQFHTSQQPKTERRILSDPRFLEICQQALARYIGPVAALVLAEVCAKKTPTSSNQLIDFLAKEIPDPIEALEFRSQILPVKSMAWWMETTSTASVLAERARWVVKTGCSNLGYLTRS